MISAIEHLGLVDEDQLDLGQAALDLAALDHTDIDLAPSQALLAEITARLMEREPAASAPGRQALALSGLLAAEFGFTGDRETYDDPANADLIEVLRRRRGLPVALSLLYVAVARRAGWAAHVLDTPGHAMAAIGTPAPALVDPFDDGAVFAAGRSAGHLGALAPMTNRAVLVRLLMNQVTRAARSKDFSRALTVIQRITTAAPAYSPGWWEQARLELATGATGAARLSLNSMLETTKDGALRDQIMKALASLDA